VTILGWLIVSLLAWLFLNLAVFGLLDFHGRRANKPKRKSS
jgi:hypothetical protein